jgi:hypothetical protein
VWSAAELRPKPAENLSAADTPSISIASGEAFLSFFTRSPHSTVFTEAIPVAVFSPLPQSAKKKLVSKDFDSAL